MSKKKKQVPQLGELAKQRSMDAFVEGNTAQQAPKTAPQNSLFPGEGPVVLMREDEYYCKRDWQDGKFTISMDAILLQWLEQEALNDKIECMRTDMTPYTKTDLIHCALRSFKTAWETQEGFREDARIWLRERRRLIHHERYLNRGS